jgi:biopolymer transport protein ExbD
MPAVKPKRQKPGIDMTAMVDVAFLLLTFFILTTKFKAEETFPVDTPAAASAIPLPQSGVVVISVDSIGRISFGLADFDVKIEMLDIIEAQYGYSFSEEGKTYFSSISDFGVPFSQLNTWLNQESPEMMKEFAKQATGIPVSKDPRRENDLIKWIRTVRRAARRVDKSLMFAIKGHEKAAYPIVDEVIYTFQEEGINRFNLVTEMRSDPRIQAAAAAKEGEE